MTAYGWARNNVNTFIVGICCVAMLAMTTGCLPPRLSDDEELAVFDSIEPAEINATVINEKLKASVPPGNYIVGPGDKLSINIRDIMETLGGSETSKTENIMRRVRSDGTISLPMANTDITVAEKTLLQVEEAIEKAYWPELVLQRPAVVAEVEDYATISAGIDGAGIFTPGFYRLIKGSRNLASLIMSAGGISPDQGVSQVEVFNKSGEMQARIPFTLDGALAENIKINEGDRVVVYPQEFYFVTILGQCSKPGRYPVSLKKPPMLIEVLGAAGGVREVEDPRYISIYRKDATDELIKATFRLNKMGGLAYLNLLHDQNLGDGAFATVKAGDVIMIERTVRSRTRQFINDVVNLSINGSITGSAVYYHDFKDNPYGENNYSGEPGQDTTTTTTP